MIYPDESRLRPDPLEIYWWGAPAFALFWLTAAGGIAAVAKWVGL